MKEQSNRSILASKLAGGGIRLTRQRRVLLDVIENSSGHLHASDLVRLAKERDERIDRATVYRTLSLLKRLGLVEELDLLHLDGSEHHYELRDRNSHVHIGCTGCGRILEFSTDLVERLDAQIRQKTRFQVDSIRIEVSALCTECQQRR
ncbi:MAG: transcriptional repressor [Armatimonadetes bacterium]|nr:transcriptional repressor [Armatimonadota bacterium]